MAGNRDGSLLVPSFSPLSCRSCLAPCCSPTREKPAFRVSRVSASVLRDWFSPSLSSYTSPSSVFTADNKALFLSFFFCVVASSLALRLLSRLLWTLYYSTSVSLLPQWHFVLYALAHFTNSPTWKVLTEAAAVVFSYPTGNPSSFPWDFSLSVTYFSLPSHLLSRASCSFVSSSRSRRCLPNLESCGLTSYRLTYSSWIRHRLLPPTRPLDHAIEKRLLRLFTRPFQLELPVDRCFLSLMASQVKSLLLICGTRFLRLQRDAQTTQLFSRQMSILPGMLYVSSFLLVCFRLSLASCMRLYLLQLHTLSVILRMNIGLKQNVQFVTQAIQRLFLPRQDALIGQASLHHILGRRVNLEELSRKTA